MAGCFVSDEARAKAKAAAEAERLMKIDMALAEEMQGEEDAQAAALRDRCVRAGVSVHMWGLLLEYLLLPYKGGVY